MVFLMHFFIHRALCSLTIALVTLAPLIPATSGPITVEISTQDLTFEINTFGCFSVHLSSPSDVPVPIHFTYTKGSKLIPLPDDYVIHNGTSEQLYYNVTANDAGHTTIKVNATPANVDTSEAFVRVGVYYTKWLNTVSVIVGWIYFFCWSISFYPQIYDNWKRKSVIGLNFDFLGLNLTGFIAYSVFNIGLAFVPEVKSEYHSLHPTGVIPVEINDVVFAVHAVFATAVTIAQCFLYERGNQVIALPTVGALAAVWSVAAVYLLVTALNVVKTTPWLNFLYFFSYVKFAITLTKYIPQVYYNYRRQSTKGWSIGTVLTDFIGGILSIMQMFIIAHNFDDWGSIYGNFTKFGLGLASIAFDVIFMVQHYCLYRGRSGSEQVLSKLIA